MNHLIDKQVVSGNLSKKTTQQLLDVLHYSQDDYNPQAIDIIKSILLGRGTSQSEIENAETSYKNIIAKTKPKTTTQKKPTFFYKALMWLLTLATLAMAKWLINQAIQSGALDSLFSSK